MLDILSSGDTDREIHVQSHEYNDMTSQLRYKIYT